MDHEIRRAWHTVVRDRRPGVQLDGLGIRVNGQRMVPTYGIACIGTVAFGDIGPASGPVDRLARDLQRHVALDGRRARTSCGARLTQKHHAGGIVRFEYTFANHHPGVLDTGSYGDGQILRPSVIRHRRNPPGGVIRRHIRGRRDLGTSEKILPCMLPVHHHQDHLDSRVDFTGEGRSLLGVESAIRGPRQLLAG